MIFLRCFTFKKGESFPLCFPLREKYLMLHNYM